MDYALVVQVEKATEIAFDAYLLTYPDRVGDVKLSQVLEQVLHDVEADPEINNDLDYAREGNPRTFTDDQLSRLIFDKLPTIIARIR